MSFVYTSESHVHTTLDREEHIQIAFALDSSYEDILCATQTFSLRSGEKRLWRRNLGVLNKEFGADGQPDTGSYCTSFSLRAPAQEKHHEEKLSSQKYNDGVQRTSSARDVT